MSSSLEMRNVSMGSINESSVFDARVMVTLQMERLIVNAAQELAKRAIHACAEKYGFNGSEAIEMLNLDDIKVSRQEKSEKQVKKPRTVVEKCRFPLPYNGLCNEEYCNGIRQNNGLYTQCQTVKKGKGMYCKSCQASADKNGGIPEYGNMSSRQAVGIFDYVDRKGRKPVAYTKVMKKFNVTQEEVLEEAGKLNMIIDENHFVDGIEEGKRGRPSSKKDKAAKEPKGTKGRPKKTKKVLEIAGDEDDLFASLVATANNDEESESEEEPVVKEVAKKSKSEEEKEEKEAQRLKEKEVKEAQRLKEKEEKEAQRLKEKEEKEAKLVAEKEAKALKKQQEEEAKALKKQQEEETKAQRLKEKEEKASTKSKKPVVAMEVEEEQEAADVVKKIEFEGKKYLKSKKTGLIYDYKEYVQNGDQVIVGKWNETKNKIDFAAAGEEESEEEYEEEE
jgi:chemotaxis protein histidine kinase CheA